ncbi:MAG TPA: FlgD immunoglobulin-like domain containing protein, partial [Candidatus Eisenbacteria bacterium]|nr:FlgD immunoglobulin-like domain containing protein [Candidatus Eisenbacteria bacterium]
MRRLLALSMFATLLSVSSPAIAQDAAPVVTAPATRFACENALLTFTVSAVDPDGDAIASLTAAGTVITAGATFTVGAGNTSGTLSWTPTFTSAGAYGVTFTAQNALSGSASTSILVGNGCDRAPVVVAPVTQTGCPGELLTFTVQAADPDGDAITGLTASGSAITAGGAFTSNVSHTSGTFSWTPASTGTFGVTFTAVNTLTGQASTAISVSCGVRPAVTAPATASVNEGSLLTFTVTATEPDGPAFVSLTAAGSAIDAGAAFTAGAPGGGNISGTFSWTPNLTQAGAYSVTFTATSNAPGTATTNITVMDVDGPLPARAFTSNSYRTIRLSSGRAFWCASVEPLGGSFDVADIVPTSVVLISPGTGSVSQISAVSGKGVVVGDADKNDVEDVTYCFSKEDLRLLFSDVHGKTTLDVTLAGTLTSGRPFSAPLSIDVIGSGGGQAVSVAPNPFNPSGVLSIVSTRSGVASIRIFDHTGRLVRTLEQGTLPAGRHDVRIDGRDESGRLLATGIYFYRVDLAEGTF